MKIVLMCVLVLLAGCQPAETPVKSEVMTPAPGPTCDIVVGISTMHRDCQFYFHPEIIPWPRYPHCIPHIFKWEFNGDQDRCEPGKGWFYRVNGVASGMLSVYALDKEGHILGVLHKKLRLECVK